MKLPLKGVIPPLVTPLLTNRELDINGLEKLIEHIIEGGVHGVFLLGTTGEGPSLSNKVKKELVITACEIINKRIPVLVNITDTSFDATLKIANFSQKVGADALVLAAPYYFPISQQEIIDYLTVLAPQLPLPFLIYDIPSCTKIHLSIGTIKKAKELGAIGLKDSSEDLISFYRLIEEFKASPDFSIFTGTEIFLSDTILNGGHGAVAGGANIFPKLFVDLYDASCSKNLKRIQPLRETIMKLNNTLYNLGGSSTGSIQAIKSALEIMGICSDQMAHPLRKFDTENKEKIRSYLEQFILN